MKINWNNPDFRKAYKPVPEAFQNVVSQTVRSVEEKEAETRREPGIIHRKMFVPVLAVILVIATAAACAVSWPTVMEWISGSGSVQELVHTMKAENSADGITARIDSIVFDGERFLFGYQLENEDPTCPAMVVIDSSILVNGSREGLESVDADTADPQIVPSPRIDVLPVARNPVSGTGWSLPISRELTGEVTCEISFCVYRPVKSFVYVRDEDSGIDTLDEYDPEEQAEILDAWETMKGFRNLMIADPGEKDQEAWSADGYTVIDEEGRIGWNEEEDTDLYHMRETARIPVTVRFDAGSMKAWDYSGTTVIGREDCTVDIETVRFSPLSTRITFLLIPRENTEEAARALLERYGSWWLTDEQGNRIEPKMYEKMTHNEPDIQIVDQWNDQYGWVCVCQADFSGLEPWPESVGLVTEAGELTRFDLK
jgi:hypothetical protein